MKKTKNLSLDLFGTSLTDKQQKFKTWRLAMCGEEDSNMVKIDNKFGTVDTAISTKAEKLYVDTELAKKANDVLATTSQKGQMSPEDKTRLDGMWNGQAGNTDILAHNVNPDAHPDRVTIDGETSNVNFVRNDVVQDGLVDDSTLFYDGSNSKCTIFVKIKTKAIPLANVVGSIVSSKGWKLETSTATSTFRIVLSDGQSLRYLPSADGFIGIATKLNQEHIIALVKDGFKMSIYFDGKVVSTILPSDVTFREEVYSILTTSVHPSHERLYSLTYHRALTPQEIQHNFYVLNNTPSINRINDYALSTDTDHVQDRTGRVQDTINRVFYKQNCKEFTSNGEPIVVNNGMDGYVLSGKIEGQTVKCIYSDSDWVTVTGDGINYKSHAIFLDKIPQLKPSNTYVLLTEVKSNTLNYDFRINSPAENRALKEMVLINIGKTGIYKNIVTSLDSFSAVSIGINTVVSNTLETGTIIFRRSLIEITDINKVNSYIPFGLSSTQATITNNGLKSTFYANLEDKLAGKLIELAKVGDVADTLEIKEDGSGVLNKLFSSYTITQDTKINLAINEGYSSFAFLTLNQKLDGKIICDKLEEANVSVVNNDLGIKITGDNKIRIRLWTGNDKTLEEYKAELIGLNFIYELATPIVTHLDKSIVPAILTQATNTFTFSDAVAASKVTIQAPTTDDIAKSYTVTLLNSWVQTASTAIPAVNLLKNGNVEIQMDLTAPSTGMNSTIFTLPTELRPKTNTKIPVFVNGVSQLATVNASTGNIVLASTPSASANVYIKTDFRRDI